jgi:hypothetical protein
MVAPACRQRLTTVVDESGQIYAIATTEKASQPGDVNRA